MPVGTKDRTRPVKLIVGLLYGTDSPQAYGWAVKRLASTFGDIERTSPPYPFAWTDYYKNIAPNLTRRFLTFAGLRHPFGLVVWKRLAISIEAESALDGGGRALNIDPGYLDGARLILASTKDNAHRVYLWDDIFAEATLCRKKSGWESFPYTFPDFASGEYFEFLDLARADWKRDLKAAKDGRG
jgi:hypothetical protein